MRVHCLRVNVERDAAVRVSQMILHGVYNFAARLQHRAEGVTEGVPADVPGDASFACDRLDTWAAD